MDRPHAPTKLLIYNPFTTFSGDNPNCDFLLAGGENGLDGWDIGRGEDSDREALWSLGKSAYDKMPAVGSANEFEEGLKGFYKYIQESRGLIDELRAKKNIDVRCQSGHPIAPDWAQKAEPSEILSLAWTLRNSVDHEGNDEVNEIFLQLFCFACLLEIDNALIGLCLNSRDGIASALEACEANANATAIASRDVELQRARKQLAVQAALSRHKKDPKQKEKQRIFKCWMEWQKNPGYYTGKADFARQMIAECEHLTSTKNIEDWCRLWEKENG